MKQTFIKLPYAGARLWRVPLAFGRCYHRTIQQITWCEQDLYGSSRIGSWKPELNLSTGGNTASTIWQSAGNKQYELANHLGNVLATVSDKTNCPRQTY